MAMRGVASSLAILCATSACGRIGFSAGDAATDVLADVPAEVLADAPPTPEGFVVSSTAMVAPTSFSWVAVAVDWQRKLAYVGTREAGRCVAVVDFTDELMPTIIQRIDGGRTTCLDVELLANGSLLALLSYGAGTVELISLGADPRLGAYTPRSSMTASGPRHFAIRSDLMLVAASNAPQVVAFSLTGDQLGPGPAASLLCTRPYQAITFVGTDLVAAGCEVNHSPVEILAEADLSVVRSIINDVPDPAGSGFWSATTLADGRALVLGWVGTLLASDGTVQAKWDNEGGARDVTLAGDIAWTATDQGVVEALRIPNAGPPRVVGRVSLGATGEAYGIRISPDGTRGIVVTNRGHFLVIDPQAIAPADFEWPAN